MTTRTLVAFSLQAAAAVVCDWPIVSSKGAIGPQAPLAAAAAAPTDD